MQARGNPCWGIVADLEYENLVARHCCKAKTVAHGDRDMRSLGGGDERGRSDTRMFLGTVTRKLPLLVGFRSWDAVGTVGYHADGHVHAGLYTKSKKDPDASCFHRLFRFLIEMEPMLAIDSILHVALAVARSFQQRGFWTKPLVW
jgi:hypothetical protein